MGGKAGQQLQTQWEHILALGARIADQGVFETPAPSPRATADEIAECETTLGHRLPTSLRNLLDLANGCRDLWGSVHLYSTDELVDEDLQELMREILEVVDVTLPSPPRKTLCWGADDEMANLLLLASGRLFYLPVGEDLQALPDAKTFLRQICNQYEESLSSKRREAAQTQAQFEAEFRRQARAAFWSRLSARPLTTVATNAPLQRPRWSKPELVRNSDGRVVALTTLGAMFQLEAAPSPSELDRAYAAVCELVSMENAVTYIGYQRTSGAPVQNDLTRLLEGTLEHYVFSVRGGRDENAYSLLLDKETTEGHENFFFTVHLPQTARRDNLDRLVEAICAALPVRSGLAGPVAWPNPHDEHFRNNHKDPWDPVFRLCRSYADLAVLHRRFANQAHDALAGVSWLTVLPSESREFLDGLGAFREIGSSIVIEAEPEVLAARLQPWLMTRFGEDKFSPVTTSTDLPGGFHSHHATDAYLSRWWVPKAFYGTTPLEQAHGLLEQVLARANKSGFEAETPSSSPFGTALANLYNATLFVANSTDPVVMEALEFVAQYPGSALPSVYNNLLYRYLELGELDKAAQVLPDARARCEQCRFAMFFHNAACVYALRGEVESALDMVDRAKEFDYEAFDSMATDGDLAALREHPRWQQHFVVD